eukprot:343286-Chlamydomonas_euryale.AAC.2
MRSRCQRIILNTTCVHPAILTTLTSLFQARASAAIYKRVAARVSQFEQLGCSWTVAGLSVVLVNRPAAQAHTLLPVAAAPRSARGNIGSATPTPVHELKSKAIQCEKSLQQAPYVAQINSFAPEAVTAQTPTSGTELTGRLQRLRAHVRRADRAAAVVHWAMPLGIGGAGAIGQWRLARRVHLSEAAATVDAASAGRERFFAFAAPLWGKRRQSSLALCFHLMGISPRRRRAQSATTDSSNLRAPRLWAFAVTTLRPALLWQFCFAVGWAGGHAVLHFGAVGGSILAGVAAVCHRRQLQRERRGRVGAGKLPIVINLALEPNLVLAQLVLARTVLRAAWAGLGCQGCAHILFVCVCVREREKGHRLKQQWSNVPWTGRPGRRL